MGAMIKIVSKGDFHKTENFLDAMRNGQIFKSLNGYGHIGVNSLSSVTPRETGLTSESWNFIVEKKGDSYSIIWTNSRLDKDGKVPVVILLVYGHGTRTGGYVQGRNFINPAIQPVFDQIADEVWKEVQSA